MNDKDILEMIKKELDTRDNKISELTIKMQYLELTKKTLQKQLDNAKEELAAINAVKQENKGDLTTENLFKGLSEMIDNSPMFIQKKPSVQVFVVRKK